MFTLLVPTVLVLKNVPVQPLILAQATFALRRAVVCLSLRNAQRKWYYLTYLHHFTDDWSLLAGLYPLLV